jgi:hypothetical protein
MLHGATKLDLGREGRPPSVGAGEDLNIGVDPDQLRGCASPAPPPVSHGARDPSSTGKQPRLPLRGYGRHLPSSTPSMGGLLTAPRVPAQVRRRR